MNRICPTLIATTAFIAATLSGAPAAAAYPDHPVKLIVPTTAGSVPDQLARWLAERLAADLGQPVVIDNRPGASGAIGLDAVAKATPDGYTLGIQTLPFIVAPLLVSTTPFDTEKDLAPVTLVNWSFNVLVVPATSTARSVADLVVLARTKPSGLAYSSQGNGTPSHLILTLFGRHTGLNLLHAPYKGGPASISAVLSGDVDMTTGGTFAVEPHIKAGKLRALATTAPRRMAAFPDLPTLVELGYTGVELSDWQGIVTAAATPRAIVDRLHAAVARVLAQPAARQTLATLGMEPAGMGPDEFATYQHAEIAKWRKLVREAHITAD